MELPPNFLNVSQKKPEYEKNKFEAEKKEINKKVNEEENEIKYRVFLKISLTFINIEEKILFIYGIIIILHKSQI